MSALLSFMAHPLSLLSKLGVTRCQIFSALPPRPSPPSKTQILTLAMQSSLATVGLSLMGTRPPLVSVALQ
ncbi:hypothetical protein ABIC63_002505 [Pseudacidovorax sp. 1753]